MPTENVNSVQRKERVGVRHRALGVILRWAFSVFLCALCPIVPLCEANLPSNFQSPTPIRRLVILAPSSPFETSVETAYRETKIRRKRPPKPKPGQKKTPPLPPLVLSEAQWNALAERFYLDALRTRLKTHLKVSVVSEVELLQKRNELRLSPRDLELSRPETVRRLATSLKADAVLFPRSVQIGRNGSSLRVVTLKTEFGVSRPSEAASGRETRFSLVGSATSERSFVTGNSGKTDVTLTLEAARSAAEQTVHTLATGELFPLAIPGVRVALAPTVAVKTADRLRFSPQGRKTELDAVQDLPTDLTALFTPSLLPVMRDRTKSPEWVRRTLRVKGWLPADLWETQDKISAVRVQEIGRILGVDYVLLARVTQAEVDGDANTPSPEGILFEGRAEAVGVFVRVSDGVVLWTDRVSTSLSVRSPDAGGRVKIPTERKAVQEAERFALLQLVRRFGEYRSGFSN